MRRNFVCEPAPSLQSRSPLSGPGTGRWLHGGLSRVGSCSPRQWSSRDRGSSEHRHISGVSGGAADSTSLRAKVRVLAVTARSRSSPRRTNSGDACAPTPARRSGPAPGGRLAVKDYAKCRFDANDGTSAEVPEEVNPLPSSAARPLTGLSRPSASRTSPRRSTWNFVERLPKSPTISWN